MWIVELTAHIECLDEEDADLVAAILSHSRGIDKLAKAIENLTGVSGDLKNVGARRRWADNELEFL